MEQKIRVFYHIHVQEFHTHSASSNAGQAHAVSVDIFSFLSAIFKPTRRMPDRSPDPRRLVSDSGTKAAPLLGNGYVSYYLFLIEMYLLHFPF
jgi:hypothetical protein